jgi:hypothetical protein
MTESLPEHYALDAIRQYAGRTIYATDEALDALTLALAVSHAPDSFNTVPQVLVRSDKAASGKTTVLDAALACGGNAWDGSNATEPGIKAKLLALSSEGQRLTLVVDEISKIFGEAGLNGRTNPLYKLMVPRYRKTAKFAFSSNKTAEEVSSYGVTFMAGLQSAAPADLQSRSIKISMVPKPPEIQLDDSQDADVMKVGAMLGDVLHAWAASRSDSFRLMARDGLRNIHPKLANRRKQVWGSLFAVAAVAGGDWPARCMAAFQALALDASDKPVLTPSQRALLDTADILASQGLDRILNTDLRDALREIPDREAYDVGDQMFMRVIIDALGPADQIRDGEKRGRGYRALPVIEKATRLREALTPAEDDTSEVDEVEDFFAVEADEPSTPSAVSTPIPTPLLLAR